MLGALSIQTVTITVKAVNDDPELSAEDDIDCTIAEDHDCSFDLSPLESLLVTDPDGDLLHVEGPFGAQHGIVEIVDAASLSLRYTPNLNFVGNDSFAAHVMDGEGGTVEVFTVFEGRISNISEAKIVTIEIP